MKDDELSAAREWLKDLAEAGCRPHRKHAATIQRRLDMPVMPRGSEVPDDVVDGMVDAYLIKASDYNNTLRDGMRAAIDVLWKHQSAPPPVKKVETWGLVFANGIVIQNANKEYLRILSCSNPGSRVIKLVEDADADE